jgi:hypothetical protein
LEPIGRLIMELSPFKSITGSDTFWDGSMPNPLSVGIPTSVSQTTPETSVAGLRNHLTSNLDIQKKMYNGSIKNKQRSFSSVLQGQEKRAILVADGN